jgi:two-component system cell cycle sensor histidine kinase/response regulator CckA
LNKLSLADLVEIEQIRTLIEAQCNITGIPVTLLDTEGNIIAAAGTQKRCALFRPDGTVSSSHFCGKDPGIRAGLHDMGGDYPDYECRNGLWHASVSIAIDGESLAAVTIGPFFSDKDNVNVVNFGAEAAKSGSCPGICLEAPANVPVCDCEQVRNNLAFYRNLVKAMAEQGLKSLRPSQVGGMKFKKEASFFRTLIEHTHDPIYVIDPGDGGRLFYVNQAACKHFGMDRETLLKMRIPDWDPAFDVKSLDEMIEEMRKGKSLRFETIHRVASGELVPVEVTSSCLEYDGKLLTHGYFHNISERKRAEEKLRESEERYRGLVELFPEAIYIHTGGRLVFVNTQGAKLLGAERPEDLYGREALDFVHPNYRDFVRNRIINAYRSGDPNPPVEQVFVRLDGSPVPVEVASTAYTYRGEKALQVIARDITERRKIQDELLRAQKLESLGVLAGGIAHDFNNILTGILGNLSLVRMQIDSSHGIAARLEQCEKAAMQASELTRQLLTFSQGGEPVKKLLDPASLIRDAASFTLTGSNTGSIIQVANDLWCVEADVGQINQVLHNLLLNAVQAMPAGGEITVTAANESLVQGNPHQLTPGNYVRIVVKDRGCGISMENIVRVFDPYFTTKPKGSGLGLASVYSIVKRHGGAVDVTSTPGVGSIFAILLPASPGRCPDGADITEATAPAGSGRILVMDDEELIRDVATEILRFMGYEVESCADGRDAVERFREAKDRNSPFSAVILDITIPVGMGGREAAERMLEIDPSAVLIVSSGYSNDPVIANFREYGFSGTIPKPFNAEILAAELARLVPGDIHDKSASHLSSMLQT